MNFTNSTVQYSTYIAPVSLILILEKNLFGYSEKIQVVLCQLL
jgi:hypothetical protein